MNFQDHRSWLEQAEKQIAHARTTLNTNRDAFVNAPFDLAVQQLQKTINLLEEAYTLQDHDAENCLKKAQLAIVEAQDSYLLSLPSRVAEARGVWYRPTEKSLEEVSRTLDRMQAAGLNELYLETWYWGYTIFPSRTAAANQIEQQHPAFRGWDPLEAFVTEGEKRRIAVHAWLDGFMVGVDPKGGPVLRTYPAWCALSRRQVNAEKPMPQEETGFFWLDIVNPEVRQYFLNIVKEIATTYNVAGINLDFMRFPHAKSWQDAYCFSSYAREAFQREQGMDPLLIKQQSKLWHSWMAWIEQAEDDFMAELYKEMKRLSVKIIISSTPEPGVESEKIRNWSQHVDVVIPQAYEANSAQVRHSVQRHKSELLPGNLVYSGIYPMYIHLGAQETVEQVLAARDLDGGTVIFAFGQATDETIHALRKGPWRNRAISTGLFPIKAVHELINSLKMDIEQIYLPRHGMTEQAAKEWIDKLDLFLVSMLPEHAALETMASTCIQYLNESRAAGILHPAADLQMTNTFTQILELLLYAHIKKLT